MSSSYQPGKPDIMVVDDTPASLNLLATILKNAGYAVRAAPISEMALQSAFEHPPALFVLDVRMPGTDGFEICRRLKQDDRTRDVPVIFISGQCELAERVRGFELGAVDFISKPLQREEVLARVHTHLALREALEKLKHHERIHAAEIADRLNLLHAEFSAIERDCLSGLKNDIDLIIRQTNQAYSSLGLPEPQQQELLHTLQQGLNQLLNDEMICSRAMEKFSTLLSELQELAGKK